VPVLSSRLSPNYFKQVYCKAQFLALLFSALLTRWTAHVQPAGSCTSFCHLHSLEPSVCWVTPSLFLSVDALLKFDSVWTITRLLALLSHKTVGAPSKGSGSMAEGCVYFVNTGVGIVDSWACSFWFRSNCSREKC